MWANETLRHGSRSQQHGSGTESSVEGVARSHVWEWDLTFGAMYGIELLAKMRAALSECSSAASLLDDCIKYETADDQMGRRVFVACWGARSSEAGSVLSRRGAESFLGTCGSIRQCKIRVIDELNLIRWYSAVVPVANRS